VLAVQEGENADGPDDPEDGSQFHQVLLRQVVSRVQLEDQDMVNAGRPECSEQNIRRKQSTKHGR